MKGPKRISKVITHHACPACGQPKQKLETFVICPFCGEELGEKDFKWHWPHLCDELHVYDYVDMELDGRKRPHILALDEKGFVWAIRLHYDYDTVRCRAIFQIVNGDMEYLQSKIHDLKQLREKSMGEPDQIHEGAA